MDFVLSWTKWTFNSSLKDTFSVRALRKVGCAFNSSLKDTGNGTGAGQLQYGTFQFLIKGYSEYFTLAHQRATQSFNSSLKDTER